MTNNETIKDTKKINEKHFEKSCDVYFLSMISKKRGMFAEPSPSKLVSYLMKAITYRHRTILHEELSKLPSRIIDCWKQVGSRVLISSYKMKWASIVNHLVNLKNLYLAIYKLFYLSRLLSNNTQTVKIIPEIVQIE